MLAVGWTPASMWPFIQVVFPSSRGTPYKCGLSLQQDSLSFLIWLLEKETATAEDQPQLIQGIGRGDGVGDLFKW